MGPNPTPNRPTPMHLGEGLAVAGPRRTLSNGGLRPFHHKSTLVTRESLNFFRDRQYRQRWVQALKTALGTDSTDSVGYRQGWVPASPGTSSRSRSRAGRPSSPPAARGSGLLSSDDAFKTSARYRAVEPSSGSNVITRRARPGLAGLRPDMLGDCERAR